MSDEKNLMQEPRRMSPLHGVTSFDELEAMQQTDEAKRQLDRLIQQFDAMKDNILNSDTIPDKAAALSRLAEELSDKIQEVTSGGDVASKELDDDEVIIAAIVDEPLPDPMEIVTSVESDAEEKVGTPDGVSEEIIPESEESVTYGALSVDLEEATDSVNALSVDKSDDPPTWFQAFLMKMGWIAEESVTSDALSVEETPVGESVTYGALSVEAEEKEEDGAVDEAEIEESDTDQPDSEEFASTCVEVAGIVEVEAASEKVNESEDQESDGEKDAPSIEESVTYGALSVIDSTHSESDQVVEEKEDDESEESVTYGALSEEISPALVIDEKAFLSQPVGFHVFKDDTGTWRWIGWTSNKFIDRDGEILTDAAHKEHLAFLDENPDMAPEHWVWHVPGTARQSKADWWEYNSGFFIYSGKLTEEEAKSYLDDDQSKIGMSHGFFVLERDGNLITKYRTFEVSELPLNRAANPYTNYGTIEEGVKDMQKGFSAEKRQYLVERIGEDAVAELEANTQTAEKVLEDRGIQWKGTADGVELVEAAEEVTAAEEEVTEEVKEEAVDEGQLLAEIKKNVLSDVMQQMNLEALNGLLGNMQQKQLELSEQIPVLLEKIESLEAQVARLDRSDDEKVAEALSQPSPMAWGAFRPTEAKETEITEQEAEELTPEVIEPTNKEVADNGSNWLKVFNPDGG